MVLAVLGSVSHMTSKDCVEEKKNFRKICIEQKLVCPLDMTALEKSMFEGLEFDDYQELCSQCFNNTMNEFFSSIVCKITKFCKLNANKSSNFGPFFSYSFFNLTKLLKQLFDSIVFQEQLVKRAGHEVHVFMNAIFCFFVVTDFEKNVFIELSNNTCLNLILSAFEATFFFFYPNPDAGSFFAEIFQNYNIGDAKVLQFQWKKIVCKFVNIYNANMLGRSFSDDFETFQQDFSVHQHQNHVCF